MDHEWAAEQLQEFVTLIDRWANAHKMVRVSRRDHFESQFSDTTRNDLLADEKELDDQLRTLEPVIHIIMDGVDVSLRNYADDYDLTGPEGVPIFTNERMYEPAKNAALRALGLYRLGGEARKRLAPDAPEVSASSFHPWCWGSAEQPWRAGSYQTALHNAANTLNARLQQKIDRRDLSEKSLVQEAFSPAAPAPGTKRLRFPGDRNTDTWKSQQTGALTFGQGCFMGIRNPLAHDHEFPITEQEAVEQLAALSVLARWIDACEVEKGA